MSFNARLVAIATLATLAFAQSSFAGTSSGPKLGGSGSNPAVVSPIGGGKPNSGPSGGPGSGPNGGGNVTIGGTSCSQTGYDGYRETVYGDWTRNGDANEATFNAACITAMGPGSSWMAGSDDDDLPPGSGYSDAIVCYNPCPPNTRY